MLSFLNKKKPKSVLGLDIGSKTTKIAQIEFLGKEKPAIKKCLIMPSGSLDEGFDVNIKNFLKDNKIANAIVACSIDDPSMKIRKMELPKMPETEMIEAIKWNLRDLVESDVDAFTVNHSIVFENKNDETAPLEIIAYAINRAVIQKFQLKLQNIGLEPFFIEPASVTLASTLDRCHGKDENYIAGVHIGYKTALFYVIGKGLFLFSRPMGDISLEQQEKEKDSFNQKLALEIQKSIDTFKVNFKMEDINLIFLSGGGALLPGIADYLTENLGLKADILNPFATLSNTATLGKDILPPLFVQAIGLAYLQL